MSEERLNAYGEALWAVYDLREIWRNIGPRVAQVIKEATPGRNDACSCGSGKKYKKVLRGLRPQQISAHRGGDGLRILRKSSPSNHPLRQRVAGGFGQFFGNEVARGHDLTCHMACTLRLPQLHGLEHAVDHTAVAPQDQRVAGDLVATLSALKVVLQVDACTGAVVFGRAVDGGGPALSLSVGLQKARSYSAKASGSM